MCIKIHKHRLLLQWYLDEAKSKCLIGWWLKKWWGMDSQCDENSWANKDHIFGNYILDMGNAIYNMGKVGQKIMGYK